MFGRLLTSVMETARASMELEASAAKSGLLQRLDARFVFIAFLSLTVMTVLLKNPPSILAVIALTVVLAAASGLSIRWYIKRAWLFVPLFTVVIMIPSMTNLVTPGNPVGGEAHVLGFTLYFTDRGLYQAAVFTLRVGAAVSLMVLMIATIGWTRLMGALARLRFPSSFVMMLDLTFQHIRLMLDTVSRMFLARRSRMVGKTTNRELRQIGGSAVAHLFSRSFHMGEQVFLAMRARGYTGRPRLLGEPAARPADYGFAASLLAVGVALVLFDGPYAGWYLGRLVLFLGGIP